MPVTVPRLPNLMVLTTVIDFRLGSLGEPHPADASVLIFVRNLLRLEMLTNDTTRSEISDRFSVTCNRRSESTFPLITSLFSMK